MALYHYPILSKATPEFCQREIYYRQQGIDNSSDLSIQSTISELSILIIFYLYQFNLNSVIISLDMSFFHAKHE